jgi:hypothetical protein
MGWVLLCLLTYTVQSSFAQAHVHSAPPATSGIAALGSQGPHASQSRDAAADSPAAPAKADPSRHAGSDQSAHCPLCQFLLLGGTPLLPSFSAPVSTASAVSIVFADQAPSCSIAAVSYSWQSRGPPRI